MAYLSGRSDTDVRMSAWRLAGRGVGPQRAAPYGSLRVVWGGLRGRVGWSADFGRVTERFTAPGLEIDGPNGGVRLQDVSLEGHSRRAPSGLMQGEMTLRAASFDAATTGSKRSAFSVTGPRAVLITQVRRNSSPRAAGAPCRGSTRHRSNGWRR